MEVKRRDFPVQRGDLHGLPFIPIHSVSQSVLDLFERQGAKVIGIDMTGSGPYDENKSSERNCFYFVERHFVAFAVHQQININICRYAQESKVYLVTFTGKGLFVFNLILFSVGAWFTKTYVTVAARSMNDLKTICTAIGRNVVAREPNKREREATSVIICMGHIDLK